MSAIALNNTAHAHRGGALQQGPGNNGVGPRDGIATARDGQDTVVHSLHNLADASLHARLVAQIGHVLAAFPNDHAGFLGGDNRAQSQLGLGILFVRLGGRVAIRAEARLVFAELKLIHAFGEVDRMLRDGVLGSGHDCGEGVEEVRLFAEVGQGYLELSRRGGVSKRWSAEI